MEALNQGRKLYIKCYNYDTSLSEEDKAQLKEDIKRFITVALKEVPLKQLFHNSFMWTILQQSLMKCSENNGQVGPVIRAFESAEKYLHLLVEQPWKPEYKKLKTYGGFFKTKVQSVLMRAEDIFFAAGYTLTPGNQMLVHKELVDKDKLLLLAFDCRMASVKSQNVAEEYKTGKKFGLSFSDVLFKTFQDGSVQEQMVVLNQIIGPGPPAIPKREPLVNGRQSSTPKYYYDSVYTGRELVQDDIARYSNSQPSRSLMQQRRPTTQPYKPEYLSDPLVHSPIMNSNPSNEDFPYIDANSEEIIPELPQGTCDEHMRESLKLVNQQATVEDDWKWFKGWQDSKGNKTGTGFDLSKVQVALPPSSNPVSVQSYPPGMVRMKGQGNGMASSNKPNLSLDEGIQVDMSSRYLPSSYVPSSQVVYSSKPISQPYQQQLISDPGYSTHSAQQSDTFSHRGMYLTPTQSDGQVGANNAGSHLISYEYLTQPVPPPIPSRALKPTLQTKPLTPPDAGNGNPYIDQELMRLQERRTNLNQSKVSSSSSNQWSKIPEAHPVNQTQLSGTAPILRRDRVLKSSSLKSGDPAITAAHRVAQTRVAKSMDLTLRHWQCPSCETINISSATVCCGCAQRQGNTLRSLGYGETKKTCPSCTFENDPNRSNCEICLNKLEDRFTYV